MDYDLGYFDDEAGRVEPIANRNELAPQVGFEPTTLRLTGEPRP